MFAYISNSPTEQRYNFIFITNQNSMNCCNAILDWLQQDYEQKNHPRPHFWHNRRTIKTSFEENDAMVVLNNKDEVIAYMIWDIWGARVEINIVEVKEAYRRQGLMTEMFSKFCEKFPDVCVLSASVIPSACKVFNTAGWKRVTYSDVSTSKYYKIIKPQAEHTKNHKNGLVLAACSDNYYKVQNNLTSYHEKMRYFNISLDKQSKLLKPIIIENFHHEGYVGIYFNGDLIADGKGKHLFNYPCTSAHCLLVIDKMQTTNQQLLNFIHNWPTILLKENSDLSIQSIKLTNISKNKRKFFKEPGVPNQTNKKPRLEKNPDTTTSQNSRCSLSQPSLFNANSSLEHNHQGTLIELRELLLKAFNHSLELAIANQNKFQNGEESKTEQLCYHDIDNIEADIEHIRNGLLRLNKSNENKLISFITVEQWVSDDIIIENPTIFLEVINILKQQPNVSLIQMRVDEIKKLCKNSANDLEIKKSPRNGL